jgi:hypothetical protein
MNRRSFVLSGFALALLATSARAQQEALPPTVVVVRPAKEPVPALRYSLLPPAGEQIPGNAAIFYHRAIEGLIRVNYGRQIQSLKTKQPPGSDALTDQVAEWLAMPVARLPLDAVRKLVQQHQHIFNEVGQGARRDDCDWEFDRRDEGYSLVLDDIQATRQLARLVALRARLETAEGRIDPAIHWIGTGLALARHVGTSRMYIQSLIAASIVQEMANALEQLVQAPGCPNLYWALAALPRPFIDLSAANEGERRLLEREFPRLRGMEETVWSLEQARAFGDEIERKGGLLFGRSSGLNSSLTQPSIEDFASHMAVASLVARTYPEAKRALTASGMATERVEAMPAIQVVAIHSYRIFEEKRDDVFKWTSLPYSQGYRGMLEAEKKVFVGVPIGIPFIVVLPAIQSVFNVPERMDRRFAVIRIIEAVRLYAASHDGALPPNLEALSESPAPLDPATGTPFGYSVDGQTATVEAPPPPGLDRIPQNSVRYQIKVAR